MGSGPNSQGALFRRRPDRPLAREESGAVFQAPICPARRHRHQRPTGSASARLRAARPCRPDDGSCHALSRRMAHGFPIAGARSRTRRPEGALPAPCGRKPISRIGGHLTAPSAWGSQPDMPPRHLRRGRSMPCACFCERSEADAFAYQRELEANRTARAIWFCPSGTCFLCIAGEEVHILCTVYPPCYPHFAIAGRPGGCH